MLGLRGSRHGKGLISSYSFIGKSMPACSITFSANESISVCTWTNFQLLILFIHEFKLPGKAIKFALERHFSPYSSIFGCFGDYAFVASTPSRTFFQEFVYQKIKAVMEDCWEETLRQTFCSMRSGKQIQANRQALLHPMQMAPSGRAIFLGYDG